MLTKIRMVITKASVRSNIAEISPNPQVDSVVVTKYKLVTYYFKNTSFGTSFFYQSQDCS